MINTKENLKRIDQIKAFILDMDGTIYLGNSLFPFTKKFLEAVRHSGKDFYFFTNNSSKNRETYAEKLKKMDIPVPEDKILISNDVIINWLKENHAGKSCYVVGTPLLIDDFKKHGIAINDTSPDIVILGFDTTLTYEKLEKACHFVRLGSPIYGVNPDFTCPTETGFIPDCGSMAALITAATGTKFEFFGKPSEHTLKYILDTTGYNCNELAIIGDRLKTDIALTNGTDVTSILVLTGETQLNDLEKSEIQPDLVFSGLDELTQILQKGVIK